MTEEELQTALEKATPERERYELFVEECQDQDVRVRFSPAKGCGWSMAALLAVAAVRLSEINWLGGDVEAERPLMAKVRSLAKPVSAVFDGETVRFGTTEYGVAPGQAAVLYDGDRMLGGGWIDETEAALMAA